MIILDATTRTIELDLNGAVATNQLPFVASYVDMAKGTMETTAASMNTGASNNTTAVTMVAAPGANQTRQMKFLSVRNADTAAVLLWIQINDNSTLREIWKGTLAIGDSLIYTDTQGWFVLTTSGSIKSTGGVDGPGLSTDNALVRWDGTGGTAIQNSGWTLADTDVLTAGSHIALGANYISRAGTAAGFSLDASNNATLSAGLSVVGKALLLKDASTAQVQIGNTSGSGSFQIGGTTVTTTGSNINSSAGTSANYNGLGIEVNATDAGAQANTGLPSWRVQIGGGTSEWNGGDAFKIGRVAAGGTFATPTVLFTLSSAGNATLSGNLTVSGGLAYLNDTSNADMTLGLTINQGANDNEILAFKSSDVAHGMTGVAEADTYYKAQKVNATAGGGWFEGFSSGTSGIYLVGSHTTDDTTKSTAGVGAIVLRGNLRSGTTQVGLGADANILALQTSGTTRFLWDAEGSAHADVEWIAFDKHDDLALLNSLDAEFAVRRGDPIKAEFGRFLSENKATLQREKIVNFYDDGPRAMLNTTRLHMLEVGAIRQLGRAHDDHEQRIQNLTAKLNQLENRA